MCARSCAWTTFDGCVTIIMSSTFEVMWLKRSYHVLWISALALGACGLTLSFTLQAGSALRAAISQALAGGAMIGLLGAALMRPRARQPEAMRGVGGAVAEIQRRACTFADVAANETALSSLIELRDYLRTPEKYVRLGARMPRGVLLYGPPGTGKTLLARALAGEANVPFFALSGSDFVEKYVGVGAGRVRELFRKAQGGEMRHFHR